MKNEPVTKQDFESLKKELFDNFASKQDLDKQKNELLEKLVDKETHKKDLESLRNELLDKLVDKETHKKDIEPLATKDMLRWESYEIRKEVSDLRDEVKEKFDIVLSAIDGIAKQFTDYQIEKAASEGTFQRHERWLENHDERIEQLERTSA